MSQAWVVGGHQTDFARNWGRAGADYADLFAAVVPGALSAAGVRPADVDVVHVGNAFGQLFTGQGHLGAMAATVEPGLAGRPGARHEAACASGGIAILAATAELAAGRYDVALVIGAELEKTTDGGRAAELMAAAAWVGHEAAGVPYVWPWAFDEIAAEYDRRFGLDEEALHRIGEINLGNAKGNPLAQTRDWQYPAGSFAADDSANPVVHGRLRRSDCSQITDGAAAVVIVSERYLREHPAAARRASRISGWGHRTSQLGLGQKLRDSEGRAYVMPHVRDTIVDAYRRAGISGPEQLDAIETHDCFTPSQYLAIDHFGITAPGDSWRAVRDGTIERGGAIPMNASGGLIGVGHPVGATGVRMALDAHRQVIGAAEGYQVPDARRVATLNIGGSTATAVSLVLERG